MLFRSIVVRNKNNPEKLGSLRIVINCVSYLIEEFHNLFSLLVSNSRFSTYKVKPGYLFRSFLCTHLFKLIVSVYRIK
jgi:hypothetical protein